MFLMILRLLKEIYYLYFKKVYYFDPLENRFFDLKKQLSKKREEGISGFMRLRDEEEFIGKVIESVIKHLDELIIVYNFCKDKTPEIVRFYEKKYPDKIRVYEYNPRVYSQFSKKHSDLPYFSKHSLVNYSNFALAKTSKKIAVKIDGDDLFFTERLKKITKKIKYSNLRKCVSFYGVNLWEVNRKIYVNANRKLMGGFKDHCFFPVSKRTFFVKSKLYETLLTNFKTIDAGILFFHLKGVKKDRGLGYYDIQKSNKDFNELVKKYYNYPKIISWEEFQKENPSVKEIDLPFI